MDGSYVLSGNHPVAIQTRNLQRLLTTSEVNRDQVAACLSALLRASRTIEPSQQVRLLTELLYQTWDEEVLPEYSIVKFKLEVASRLIKLGTPHGGYVACPVQRKIMAKAREQYADVIEQCQLESAGRIAQHRRLARELRHPLRRKLAIWSKKARVIILDRGSRRRITRR